MGNFRCPEKCGTGRNLHQSLKLLFSCKDLHSWRSRNCLACSCASLLHVAWTSSTHVWDNLAACDKSSSWQGRSAHYGAAEGWRSAEQSPRYYSSNSNAVLKPFSRVWRMELQDRRIVALLCTDTRGTTFFLLESVPQRACWREVIKCICRTAYGIC